MLNFLGQVVSSGINAGAVGASNTANANLTRQSWARDDNAVQRRAKDLLAAGINPLMAAGQDAGNSAPIPMKAPQVGDFGAALISDKQTDIQKKLMDNTVKISEAKLLNETALAQAQVLDTIARAKLTDLNSAAAKIDIDVAKTRKGFVREQASTFDNIFKMLDRVNPELSVELLSALKDMTKGITQGVKSLSGGPPVISLFPPKPPKEPKPKPAEKPKPLTEAEKRRRYYALREEAAKRPLNPGDPTDSDYY